MEESREGTTHHGESVTTDFAIDENAIRWREMSGERCDLSEERQFIFWCEEGEECRCLSENKQYEEKGRSDPSYSLFFDEEVKSEEKREEE